MPRLRAILSWLFFPAFVIAQTSTEPVPRFDDYLITDTFFAGRVHPPEFATKEQEQYRRELSIVSDRRPNFAGRYRIVEMFCGPRCERIALVDGTDGTIYPSPFRTPESEFALPPPNWDFQKPRYNSLSNLLVIPNICPEGPSSCGTFYFLWENKQFRLIQKVAVSADPIIPAESPLIGTWEGQWDYTDGMEERIQRFILTFTKRARGLKGSYRENDGSPSRAIARLTATKPDLSTYRMEVDGSCWNVRIDGDHLSGVWNGGPCSKIGVGVGARLIALQAKRVSKANSPH